MPGSAMKMREQLGLEPDFDHQPFDRVLAWGLLAPGSRLAKGPALFPRIEAEDK